MQLINNVWGLILLMTIGLATGSASAQTPCIDARPSGMLPASITFVASDGRSNTRTGAVLLGFEAASNTLIVSDSGPVQRLSLRDWTRIHILLQEPDPVVQMPIPVLTPISTLVHQKYRLSTMRIAGGVVQFGDCHTEKTAAGGIRFRGELTFDTKNDALTINGTFVRYEMRGRGSSINPGIRKGGVP